MMLFTKVLVMISGIIIAFAAFGQDVGNGEDPVPTDQKVDADGGQATDALADQEQVNLVLEDDLVHYFVKLKRDEGSDNGKVVEPKGKCKKHNHLGCLLFGEKQRGKITFYLPGYKIKNDQCPQAKNVITKIELTTNEDTKKKGNFKIDPKLDDWVKMYAFEDVDPVTGIVYEAQWDEAWAQTTLFNKNDHKHEIEGEENELSFWYRVTVTSCPKENHPSETETWVVDPRGDNEGLD